MIFLPRYTHAYNSFQICFRAGSEDPMSREEAMFHASGIIVFGMLYTFTHHPYFFGVQHLGMKARVALCAVITGIVWVIVLVG